jgi:putative redox protein
LKFKGNHNNLLVARLDLPENNNVGAFCLFAHCFTCNKNFKVIHHISKALNEQNIAVFRFDFTGLGESEGEFSNTNLSSNIDDLLAAAEFMKIEFESPKLLIGHSLGGSAILQAAHSIQSTKAVTVLSTPFDPSHLEKILVNDQQELNKKGHINVRIGGRKFTIEEQFFKDLEKNKMHQNIEQLNAPLLVVHSTSDNIVSIDNGLNIFSAAKHPKCFLSLENADHLFSDPNDSSFVGHIIARWSQRYIYADRDSSS